MYVQLTNQRIFIKILYNNIETRRREVIWTLICIYHAQQSNSMWLMENIKIIICYIIGIKNTLTSISGLKNKILY